MYLRLWRRMGMRGRSMMTPGGAHARPGRLGGWIVERGCPTRARILVAKTPTAGSFCDGCLAIELHVSRLDLASAPGGDAAPMARGHGRCSICGQTLTVTRVETE